MLYPTWQWTAKSEREDFKIIIVIFIGLNMYQILLKYLPYSRYTRKERNECRLTDLPESSSSGL
jgi:hypothetical protein